MEGMDLDQELMQKFSCMGTTDKDILISEFQRLLGFQLNPAGCAFFLDMTNWNLQAAIGAYYDFESPNISAPCMSFVKDVTIGEGESVPPDTPFTKTWRIQNTGAESWPPGVSLKYVGGDQFGHINMVMVRSLDPQEMTDVSVQMHSPVSPGMYQGQWRMCTATGLFYGGLNSIVPVCTLHWLKHCYADGYSSELCWNLIWSWTFRQISQAICRVPLFGVFGLCYVYTEKKCSNQVNLIYIP
ncbi:protein ILRUN-like isoform X2 [Pelmatolapia mariae]|uniref:protein ILRUN-like isoform X2 n=1 Tax=Pelmatolapia mariae TaxID=158779 RepID=UPI002FE6119E